jgi:hypothetical protein
MEGTDSELNEVYASEALRIAYWRNIVIIELLASPPGPDAEKLRDLIYARGRRSDKKLGLLYVLRITTAPPPDGATLDVYRELMRDPRGYLCATAVLSEQQGFTAAMVRSVITGLILIARPRFPTKVFGDLGETTHWLAEHLPKADAGFGTADELRDAVSQAISPASST